MSWYFDKVHASSSKSNQVVIKYLLFFILISIGCKSKPAGTVDSTSRSQTHSDHRDSLQNLDPSQTARIEFGEKSYDFGEIYHAERVTHEYLFSNVGRSNLVIKNVHASCGCTKPTYSSAPIAPGQEGSISVTYNSVGKQGFQRARIRVTTNDPLQPIITLILKGRVLVKPREPRDPH